MFTFAYIGLHLFTLANIILDLTNFEVKTSFLTFSSVDHPFDVDLMSIDDTHWNRLALTTHTISHPQPDKYRHQYIGMRACRQASIGAFIWMESMTQSSLISTNNNGDHNHK